MAKPKIESVDAYIAAQPAPARAALKKVRATFRKALAGAEEIISYKIPAYRVGGRVAIYFAGWSKHFAIYPVRARVIESFKGKLPPCEIRGSTLRFPLAEPVPTGLITHVAKEMARNAAEKRTKSASPRKKKTLRRKRRAKS